MGKLRKSKRTVVLVTHQLQYLQQADKVICTKIGQIIQQCSSKPYKSYNLHLRKSESTITPIHYNHNASKYVFFYNIVDNYVFQQIVVMHGGHIVLQGTFEDIVRENPTAFEKWRQAILESSAESTSMSEADADSESYRKKCLRKRRYKQRTSFAGKTNTVYCILMHDPSSNTAHNPRSRLAQLRQGKGANKYKT